MVNSVALRVMIKSVEVNITPAEGNLNKEVKCKS